MQNPAGRPHDAQIVLRLHPVKEAAQILGCSDMHVYRLIAAGDLSAVNIAMPGATGARKSKTRIRSDELAAYIERKTRSRSSAASRATA
jgi:excisionase family DNA binding protein